MRTLRRLEIFAAPAMLIALVSICPSIAMGQANVSYPAAPQSSLQSYNVSDPVILQYFESSYLTMANKMPDVFAGGYGTVYMPPPGFSTTTNSVGYDIYDRFNMGSPTKPTTYGTQNEFAATVQNIHAYGGYAQVDLLWNDSGAMNDSTSGFAASGGYPGLAVVLQDTNPNNPGYNTLGYEADGSSGAATYTDNGTTYHYYGDYHDPTEPANGNDGQVAGLDDIAQENTTYKFIRQPTTAGNPNNIPAGKTPWNGYLANIPTASNAQYYPVLSGTPRVVFDSQLNQTFTIYPFVPSTPMAGTPVVETAMQYLDRYAQWLIQDFNVDGFRVDAALNQPISDLENLDATVYNASNRTLLNGQKEQIFSFSEVATGNASTVNNYILLNDTNPSSGTVQGNRDALDFALYGAMYNNLSTSGSQATFDQSGGNNWNSVVNSDMSVQNTGLQDGAQGVKYVSEQDDPAPSLSQVAYAYTLMLPGQATVYFNGQQFNNEQANSFNPGNFPEGGATDENDSASGALGGADDTNVQNAAFTNLNITNLVDLRNRYGRGNYRQDWLEQNVFAFERTGSCIVLLSNSTTPGYESRTISVTFAPGTWLEEMTGNATSSYADPNGDISQFLQVQTGGALQSQGGGEINARFLENGTYALGGGSTYQTNDGFLIYALPTPTGSAAVSNVASVMQPQTTAHTAPGSFEPSANYSNGLNRNASVSVIDADTTPSFTLSLNTVEANLQVSPTQQYHDVNADGDNAQFTIDGGTITVAPSGVTSTTPGSNGEVTNPGSVSYGYQNFANSSPGYNNAASNYNGAYSQLIDTAGLSIGYHYIETIAFRHNSSASAPPLYNDWYQTIYVDRGTPTASAQSLTSASSTTQQFDLNSDGTTTSEYAFLNLPPSITSAQILNMISTGSNTVGGNTYQGGVTSQIDTNLFTLAYNDLKVTSGVSNFGLQNGNDEVTVVSFRPDFNSSAGTASEGFSIIRLTANQSSSLAVSNTVGSGLGDLDASGAINTTDVLDLLESINKNGAAYNPAGDFYGDGTNSIEDWYAMGSLLQVDHLSSALSYYASVSPSVTQPSMSSMWTPSGGASGTWSSTSNWSGSKIPQTAQQSVTLGPTNSAVATVTLDGNWTIGSLNFYSNNSYTLAQGSSGTLAFNNGTSPAAINVLVGSHTISAPISFNNGATISTNTSANALAISGAISGSGGVTIQGPGTVTFSGTNSYSGGTAVNSGLLAVSSSSSLPAGGSLSIGTATSSAAVTLPTTAGVIQQSSLTINPGSTLDIGATALVFPDGGSASATESQIQQFIENGIQANAGAWIISAYAKSNSLAIAYADGSDAGVGDANLLPGQVVVEPDLAGDADMNGTVNFHDLQALLGGFGNAGFWDQGNFNGDATVDFNDLQLLLGNFSNSTALSYGDLQSIEGLASEFGDVATPNADGNGFSLAAVPEPASVGLVALATLALLSRRSRRVV